MIWRSHMIIDSLDNLSLYTHLHPGFEKAAAYLQSHDLMTLPQGTIEVDGRSVYILSQINTLENTEPRFEAHAKYADIQLILDGCEMLGMDIKDVAALCIDGMRPYAAEIGLLGTAHE